MIKEFLVLIFHDLLWIPWILLFLTCNLCWMNKSKNKPNLIGEKGNYIIQQSSKKANIYIFLIIALFWLITANLLGYGTSLLWIPFIINQGLWILARIKYNRFVEKHLIILETPKISSRNNKNKLLLGRINSPKLIPRNFFLDLNDLRKHMYVCGLTGMGKSNFVQFFLIKFYEKFPQIPFLIIEFKGEYQQIKNFIPDIEYINPGEEFSLNIFDPLNSDPDIHAERLFDILRSCEYLQESSEFSPQMEKVLVDILKGVCKEPNKRNFSTFEKEIENYRMNFKNQIPMLDQTIISITNRLRRLFYGPLKKIFSQMGTFTINELFSKRICLDLGSIIRLGGEKRDALFFLNMIFKYLWDLNLSRGSTKNLCHMCILEDAQYMIPQSLLKQSKLSTYIEDVALLQRGTGEILVSIATRPAVSEDVLANAGVFVTFQSHYDTSQIQELLGLTNDQLKLIGTLQEGECITRVASIPRPILLKIPLIKKKHKIHYGNHISHTPLMGPLKEKITSNKKLTRVFVGYFHNIRGPQLFSFSNSILSLFDTQRILANIERGNGLYEYLVNENRYILYIFEIFSRWGRGNVELIMIGVKLKSQEKNLVDIKQKITEFVENQKQNSELFKICYIDRLSDEPYKNYSQEITQEYNKFFNALIEFEEILFLKKSHKHFNYSKNKPKEGKLNPAQFEALNELNTYIEYLLSKEK